MSKICLIYDEICHSPHLNFKISSTLTIFDEPTQGLDAVMIKEFFSFLIEDFSERPRTIIISSYLINEIKYIIEEVVVIDQGKLLLHKAVEDLQSYAISLSGETDFVMDYVKHKEVYHISKIGRRVTAVIKNNMTEENLNYLKQQDIFGLS